MLGHLAISRSVYRALGAPILGGLVACSASPGDPEPASSTSSANPLAIEAEAGLSAQGVLHGADGSPVDGVTVCLRTDPLVAGQGPCTTSDARGAWKIANVPAQSFVAITFEKATFVPTLRAIATGTGDVILPLDEGGLETSDAFAARTGRSFDTSRGSIAFFTTLPGAPQAVAATASLRTLDGPPAEAPRYDGTADAVAGTSGMFTGVSGGFYVLTVGDTSARCAPGGAVYGYPITIFAPSGEARILVPTVAGFLTTPVAALCVAAAPGALGE
jgi:hypothetical protein